MTNKPPSQIEIIKTMLLTGQSVDPVTAFKQYCITRLSAIIYRLRNRGYPIITHKQNNNGIAVYCLPKDWTPSNP